MSKPLPFFGAARPLARNPAAGTPACGHLLRGLKPGCCGGQLPGGGDRAEAVAESSRWIPWGESLRGRHARSKPELHRLQDVQRGRSGSRRGRRCLAF